jgi:tetratricopeptide (TPR) repeat protein
MAVTIAFFTFIMPLSKVEKYYPGGVEAMKKDRNDYEFDNYLCRTSAMSSSDLDDIVNFWKSLGAEGATVENGEKKFRDFCLTERFHTQEYIPCNWLIMDGKKAKAWHKKEKLKEFRPWIEEERKYSKEAQELMGQEKYAEAISCLSKEISLILKGNFEGYYDKSKTDDKYFHAMNYMGRCFYSMGKYKEAIDCYDKAILSYDNSLIWSNKGQCYVALGNYQAGYNCLRKEYGICETYFEMACELRDLGKYEDALLYFDKALEEYPDDTFMLYHKGICLQRFGKFDDAIECYDKVIKDDGYCSDECLINREICLKEQQK